MGEIFRFDAFELDADSYQLRREGEVVRVERIPLDLLFLLVQRRGELISRQEILDHIWGRDISVDADNSINTAIRKIRRALKDDPEKPRFLYTIPGKGYRFDATFIEQQATVSEPEPVPETRPPVTRSRWKLVAVTAIVACLVAALFLVRSKPAPGKIMLAVLPFANVSGDPGQEYFADGMTEEMITELGGLDPMHLGVIARTSAMQYKNAHKSGAQIAGELSVKYLVEGSVRRSNGRVRVTAQLIQASDQTHLWAENFDRAQGDILELQGEVARAIAGQIRLALSSESAARLARPVHVSAEAHEAYLQGLYEWNQRSSKGSTRAVSSFERAIALDPNYAAAYSALARVYAFSGLFLHVDGHSAALQLARRALELDSSLGDAHTTLGVELAHIDLTGMARAASSSAESS